MYVQQGKIYLNKEDAERLKAEERYVRKRYYAVVLATQGVAVLTRKNVASRFRVSKRTLQRWIKRYAKFGIDGLKCDSRRPKRSPRKTPDCVEDKVKAVREATGLGAAQLALFVNRSNNNEGTDTKILPRTAHRILVRRSAIKAKDPKKKYKSFEWGKPKQLMQVDITTIEGIPLLTCLDDHSRFFWAEVLADESDNEVIKKLNKVPDAENILTDNGPQFSRVAELIRKYCEENDINHIWARARHPETMGKLSAAQKHLKRVLKTVGFSGIRDLRHKIAIYLKFVNNGKVNGSTGCCAAERYASIDESWYNDFIEAFKLKGVLTPDK